MHAKELSNTAAKLESDAKKLREAAEIMNRQNKSDPVPYSGTRAEQLAKFLEGHGGGATRTEIVLESGIPPGTVASLLGSKKKFAKDSKGFWHPKKHVQEVPAAPVAEIKQQA